MIHKYIRFSTDKQDEQQQVNTIDQYLARNNLVAGNEIRDEGVSGGTSYKKRNLVHLIKMMSPGDTLIVSELSRLSRSGTIELSEMIESHFKPNRIRLIVVNVGLDIDCANINAMTELQLAMMATFAKIEKEHIRERTQSALDVRKKKIESDGGFVSKSGKWVTKLGNPNITSDISSKGGKACGLKRRKDALEDPTNKIVWELIKNVRRDDIAAIDNVVTMLNNMGIKTPKGLDYTRLRLQATRNNIMNRIERGGAAHE